MFESQQELCSHKFVLHGQTMDRHWNIEEMKHLNEKNDMTGSRQVVHAVMECTPANINKVEDLALIQEDEPRKQFKMENCVTN